MWIAFVKTFDNIVPKVYKGGMKLFVIRNHKRCGDAYQAAQGKEFGADRVWTLGSTKRQNSIDDVIRAADEGDNIGITHLWLFADTAGKSKARDQMCDAVERLLHKGCSITEMQPEKRTCAGGAELAAMLKDASNAIANGNKAAKNKKPGPAKVQVYTPDQAQTIADIWNRKDMKNDAMRLAEAHKRGFKRLTVTGWYRDVKPMLAQTNEK